MKVIEFRTGGEWFNPCKFDFLASFSPYTSTEYFISPFTLPEGFPCPANRFIGGEVWSDLGERFYNRGRDRFDREGTGYTSSGRIDEWLVIEYLL